ncbi:hypothetical protein Goari_014316 [Gossypium aridum]|uniref:RNase H type-1 domain-containing protein n=1 Tax=Gossypium aridum TaxID=34290 RepID=A0A7J8XHE6_GOSAI|nr:hypothetical protein [Gossypium aridum]
MGHELLPTKANISLIRQTISRDCTECGESVENLVHTLKDCPIARAVLTFGGLDSRLLNKDYSSCIDWIEDAIRLLDKKAMANFITTLRNSWNNRNNYIFRGKKEAAWIMWERAKTLSQDFRIHNMVNKPMLPLTTILKKWEKPLSGSVKINFNATVFNDKTGFGVIVRDSDGFVLGGSYGFKDEKMMADWTELYAFEESLKIVRSLNTANAIFETDCASLVNRIKKRREDITIMGYCINDLFKNHGYV